MTKPPAESVSVVIPLHNAAAVLDRAVRDWHASLKRITSGFEILLVDDGSTDETSIIAGKLATSLAGVRVLQHETRRGVGACLRTALPETQHPLFFYTTLDYPYTPADLGPMLTRIDHVDELMQRKLDLVSGCRQGVSVPWFWREFGRIVRAFCRIGLGFPREKLKGWLGFREHLRSWLVWAVFGDPLVDPNSAFKLIRKSLFDRFPIQSDGEFVHVEIVSKATFLTAMMDELDLTPKPDRVPSPTWDGWWKLLTRAEFTPPPSPKPVPADPPAQVLSADGIDGARTAAEPSPTPSS